MSQFAPPLTDSTLDAQPEPHLETPQPQLETPQPQPRDAAHDKAPMSKMRVVALLAALAYALLLVSTLPGLYHQGAGATWWAAVPVVLAVVAYAASVLKSVSPEYEQYMRFAQVAWLSWVTYYILSFVTHRHMHWYEVLVVMSLMAWPHKTLAAALLLTYYMVSMSAYLDASDAMQTVARAILVCTTAWEVHEAWKSSQNDAIKED